jgi:hypothetical protein
MRIRIAEGFLRQAAREPPRFTACSSDEQPRSTAAETISAGVGKRLVIFMGLLAKMHKSIAQWGARDSNQSVERPVQLHDQEDRT